MYAVGVWESPGGLCSWDWRNNGGDEELHAKKTHYSRRDKLLQFESDCAFQMLHAHKHRLLYGTKYIRGGCKKTPSSATRRKTRGNKETGAPQTPNIGIKYACPARPPFFLVLMGADPLLC